MGSFFGKPEYGTAEGAYSWQHLLFVSSLIVCMIVLAIIIGLKNRNKDEDIKNKVLIWSAIIIDGAELFKVAFNIGASDDGQSWKMNLPLFLCSIQLIVIPLAALSKGKIREASLDFVFIFGILGAILGTVGAAQNYNVYPVLSFPNVVSGLTHSVSGFASLYIVISGMASMKKSNMKYIFIILLSFCVLAFIANEAFDYNYMFLKYHDGTPYVIFYDLVNGNKILYPTIVILLFVIYILLFEYTFNFIVSKKKNKISE